ncbi:hypothetical protein [Pseudomonas sp. PLB05]|uniref:hypothetical protein n=1 Tax=Pseudomonas sp. PLB05 TaxID=2899078 RepID=UPI001E533358|nr:hypothetical protein [Pseudomonas sp. PLB05]MCD4867091.1 hypothetical protein [Pseudomonas sp. PLB05]
MTHDSGTANGLRFGHAVCMRHSGGQLITLWFADSEEIADEAVVKLQQYHARQPQLGNIAENASEAFKRREELRKWRLLHPVGENRSYDVAGFERLSLPFLDRAKLATLGKLP